MQRDFHNIYDNKVMLKPCHVSNCYILQVGFIIKYLCYQFHCILIESIKKRVIRICLQSTSVRKKDENSNIDKSKLTKFKSKTVHFTIVIIKTAH